MTRAAQPRSSATAPPVGGTGARRRSVEAAAATGQPSAGVVESVVDRVYETLRERILSGQAGRGERLRQEALAVELGVSRTPLREALRRLASEGLVELRPHRGATVADVAVADLRAAYGARLVVEPAAARLAAGRRDEAAIRRMRAATADHRAAGFDLSSVFAANRAFHRALAAGSGNPFLERFVDALWVARIGAAILERGPRELAADADEHEAIADAVEAGDEDEAERRTREHVAGAMRLFLDR